MSSFIQNESLDFSNLLKILKLKRWFILTVTIAVFAVSVIYVFRLPNIYVAKSTILVEMLDDTPLKYEEMMTPASSENTFYRTQLELLTSESLLGQTVDDLDLFSHYKQFYPKLVYVEDAVHLLRKNIQVQILRSTRIIKLEVTDRNPEMAAQIANQLSENFVKESLRTRLFISDQLLKWFPEQAKTLKENSPISQLQQMSSQEINSSLPSVMRDPVVNKIKEERIALDSEIREQSRRYTPEHPQMKGLIERAKYLESELKLQTERIVRGLKAGLAGQFNVSNIRVVDKAIPPKVPAGPRRLFNIALATMLAFLGSSGLVLIKSHMDQQVRSENDIKKIPQLTFLGYVPFINKMPDSRQPGQNKGEMTLPECLAGDHRIFDNMINIRTSVLFSMPAERSKTLMCTSSIPEEGKTTVCSLLAISLAQMGERILLIDADMRKPAIHRVFNIPNVKGLSNYLIGADNALDLVHPIVSVANLSLMTAGVTVPNPTALLNSSGISNLIRDLQNSFDRIIFDAPPSLHIPDGLILGQKLHGTILIFGSGMVHYQAGKKVKEKFDQVGAPILGAVVNRAQYDKLLSEYQYYQYYRKYSRYYAQTEN